MARRVLIAGFKHETNTFSKLKTDLAAYRARLLVHGEAIRETFAGTRTEIAAFLDAAARHGWQPILSVAADASPSGTVTREAFDTIASDILAAIDREGVPNAVLLNLHGAMVAEGAPDGEGELLRRLRRKIGRAVPIGVTLDLHANVTDDMARLADVIVSYKTYPHVDLYETGTECADLIARALSGEIRPTVSVARGALLSGLDHGRTTAPGPMREMLAEARRLHDEPGVLSTSINAGFSMADMVDAGPSAVIVGDGRDERYQEMAERLVALMWESRHVATVPLVSAARAIEVAKSKGRPGGPVLIADFADNPGGGGYGDSTGLLKAMLDAGLKDAAFASIYDPQSAATCHAAGAGARLSLCIGGRIDPLFGPPIEAEAEVVRLTDGRFRYEGQMQHGVPVDLGPSALIRIGGVEIVIASRRYQNYDLQFFKSFGIDPASRATVAVKSAQHFRAAYGPLASEIVVVDDGNGLTSENLKKLPYAQVRRPVYPLDLD